MAGVDGHCWALRATTVPAGPTQVGRLLRSLGRRPDHARILRRVRSEKRNRAFQTGLLSGRSNAVLLVRCQQRPGSWRLPPCGVFSIFSRTGVAIESSFGPPPPPVNISRDQLSLALLTMLASRVASNLLDFCSFGQHQRGGNDLRVKQRVEFLCV